MDERYLTELYHKYGGQNTFGSYQAFYNKVQNDSDYRAKLHTFIGGEKGSGKSYSDFESSVKKKRGYWTDLALWLKSNPTIKWLRAFPRR